MTTCVIIRAHCSKDKEVHAIVTNNGHVEELFAVQDGETAERYVYDGREISIREVEKKP